MSNGSRESLDSRLWSDDRAAIMPIERERCSVAGSIGRAWANDDLNETAYTLTAGVTW